MEKVKRIRLNDTRPKSNLIISGYGVLALEFRVGKIVGETDSRITLQCRDDFGYYTEDFSKRSGKRFKDIGYPSGWAISLSEIETPNAVVRCDPSKNTTHLLHEEVIPQNSNESVVWQVWKLTEETGVYSLYLKSFRRVVKVKESNEKGDVTQSTREYPSMVPFAKLLEVLAEFNEWR